MPPTLEFCGLSDIGMTRPNNQDVWTARPELGLFVLADGMGGRKGGEVAAKETVDSLCASIHQLAENTNHFKTPIDLNEELRLAIEHANRWVYKLSSESEPLAGMGTTLCCLLWTQEMIYYAHVGDSRIYRLRNGHLELLTRDHSLFARWLSKKKGESPPKNIITRAIGTGRQANPEISSCPSEGSDLFLLCSDGLTDAVRKEELQKIINETPSLETAAQNMIEYAKNMGSSDNITVLLVQPA